MQKSALKERNNNTNSWGNVYFIRGNLFLQKDPKVFGGGIYFHGGDEEYFFANCLSSAKTRKFLPLKFPFMKVFQNLLCTHTYSEPRLFLYQQVKKKICPLPNCGKWSHKIGCLKLTVQRNCIRETEVSINIGILKWSGKQLYLKPVRGKRVAIKVKTNESYSNLHQKTISKFRTF